MPDRITELETEIAELRRKNDWLHEAYERLKANPPETPEEKRQRREAQRNERMQAELDAARAKAIREIVKLLPKAIEQAHAGKPALLRMILRATR